MVYTKLANLFEYYNYMQSYNKEINIYNIVKKNSATNFTILKNGLYLIICSCNASLSDVAMNIILDGNVIANTDGDPREAVTISAVCNINKNQSLIFDGVYDSVNVTLLKLK